MNRFWRLCVVMVPLVVLGHCGLSAKDNEPRPWVLIICGPKGQFCIPYSRDMVPHRYITKTACDIDIMWIQAPTGYHVRCEKERL